MQVQIGYFGVQTQGSTTLAAATATQVLSSISNCNGVWLTNLSGATMYVGLSNAVTAAIYNKALAPGEFFEVACSGTFAQNLWLYSAGGGDVRYAVLN